jgi:hypothetical protein
MAINQPSLFGIADIAKNPEDLVAAVRAEQQARNAAKTQNLGKYAGLAQSGMETAQQFGSALGVQDPRLQRNSQVIAARDAVRAKGIEDPEEQLKEMVRELSNRGLYQEADRVMQRLQEAQKAKRTESREEERMGIERQRVGLEERRINLQLEQEKRAGKLTEAQIREINARIANVDKENYTFQVVKDAVGNITEIIAINKKNPADVKRIPVGAQEAAAGGSKPKLTDDEVRQRLLGGRGGSSSDAPEDFPMPAGA